MKLLTIICVQQPFQGIAACLLFIAVVFCCPISAQSRTIALVYDDSGSMLRQDGWVYANYATQILAASLRDDDELVSIRMNQGLVRDKLPALIKKWNKPVDKAATPYRAVENAMRVIQSAPINSAGKVIQSDEKNWLIITTDGEFDHGANPAAVRSFFNQTQGRVEVVFLLIGNAVKSTASLWKGIAPDQVRIFQVKSGQGGRALIDKMNRIAALVAGRDNQEPGGIVRSGKQIKFSSPFPIRRITLLIQQGKEQSVLPDLVTASYSNGAETSAIKFTARNIESRTGNYIKVAKQAKVIHCKNNGVIPAGDFALVFNENIERLPLQVLLETAVDLSVTLYDMQGQKILPSGGEFAVCDGDPLEIGVSLFSSRNSPPLKLSSLDLKKIQITGLMSGQSSPLTYREKLGEFRSKPQNIDQGVRSLAVEARSPGYFFLKSNVFSLRGLPCRKAGALSFSKNEWILPYSYTDSFSTLSDTATLTVSLAGGDYRGAERKDRLQVDGLPPGVELIVDGQHLTSDHPVTELQLLKNGQQLKLQLSRNRKFTSEKPVTISLQMSSGSWVEWGAPVTFKLTPQPRNISLELSPPQWSAPVTRMGGQPPVILHLMINGMPASAEEFEMWTVSEEHDGYFSLKLKRNNENREYSAKLRNFFFSPVWTTVGDYRSDFTLRGPFPLENFSTQLPVHIQWVPWWERARNTVLFFLGLFAFLWWLKRILTKKRFSRSGYVEYFSRASRRKTVPKSEYLAGNLFLSWILPTKAEKTVVEGIQFKASNSESHILIVAGQLDKKAKIGGLALEAMETWGSDATEKDQKLNNNDELVIPRQKKTEVYRYVK